MFCVLGSPWPCQVHGLRTLRRQCFDKDAADTIEILFKVVDNIRSRPGQIGCAGGVWASVWVRRSVGENVGEAECR